MKQKVIAIIQARCASTRFPNKVLEKINGRTLLQIMIERLASSKTLDKVVIATTGAPADDVIVAECRALNVAVFRGSENDVLDRYYRAAKENGASTVVRLTSDCPLVDPVVVDSVVGAFQAGKGKIDFAGNNVPTPGTFPDGMDVEVFSFPVLERAWGEAKKPSEREHVTFYFWKQPELFKIKRVDYKTDRSKVRLTVDYPEDLAVIKKLVEHFEKEKIFGSLEEILAYLDAHPKLMDQPHIYGEGWKSALEKDAKQGQLEIQRALPLKREKTEQAWKKALTLVPGGAQTFSKSPAQYVNGVAPSMLVRGRGSKVWDLDGNEYIDYTLSLGPVILGHSHPEVNRAAYECANEFFNAPSMAHPLETKLAEKIVSLVPAAEMVRFGKNGSDATAGAVRLARGVTNREVIACCGYHGWQDWFIGSTSRHKGVPDAVRKLTKPFTYNKIDTLQKIFDENKDNVAAVILEPVNFFAPEDHFLEKVQDLCRKNGALLIFDETITGFRIDMGGAQKYFGVTPDLSTFGKAMGNGYPVSVLCGKAEIMQALEEVFFSFTFGGELPSMAAALKTIEIMEREKGTARIAELGRTFKSGFNALTKKIGTPFVSCIGLDFWPEYLFEPVAGFSTEELLTLLQQEVVRQGVLTRSAPFMSLAHSNYDLDETLNVFGRALAVVKEAVEKKCVREWIEGDIIQPVIRASLNLSPEAAEETAAPVLGGRSSFN